MSWKKKGLILLAIIAIGVFVKLKFFGTKTAAVTYQTGTAEMGTLVSSISASGTISSVASTNITTSAGGVVSKVYVKDGDTVAKGQKIADIALDDDAQLRQSNAWIAYLDAGVEVKQAKADKAAADIAMWTARQSIYTSYDDIDYKNNNTTNPTTKKDYTESEKVAIDKSTSKAQLAFDVAEQKYKNADAAVSNAYVKQSAALRDYQEVSSTIYAPAAGKISNLVLAPNVQITATTTAATATTTASVSSQDIGKIENPTGQIQAKVNLTEVDSISVKPGQKVTLTLDAYTDKTFTGKVLAISTTGTTNSGVTSYPASILLDPTTLTIYPGMAVSAEIITNVKPDVLLVPSSAVQTANGVSTVQVMQNSTPSSVTVEIGDTNGSQVEIKSGLKEGQTIVTSTITAAAATTTTNTTSPFSTLNRGTGTGNTRNFGGNAGGAVFIQR